MFRRGKKLVALVDSIDSELMSDIKNEKYKNFSVALYPNLNIRHIGILGAMPPAIKGLNKNGIVYFHKEYEYNEYNFQVAKSHSIDIINNDIDDNVDNTKDITNTTNATNTANTSETENSLLKNKLFEYSASLQTLKETNAKLIAQLQELEKQNRHNTFNDYANSIILSNNISLTPSQKSMLIDMLELAYQADISNIDNAENTNNNNTFSESTETLTNKIKTFISMFSNRTGQNQIDKSELFNALELKQFNNDNAFCEIKNPNIKTDDSRYKMHLSALEYCQQNPNVTYAEAIEYIVSSGYATAIKN
jgi:hypothetical protein